MNKQYFDHCGYNWSQTVAYIESSEYWSVPTTVILVPFIPLSLVCNGLLLGILLKTGEVRKPSSFLASHLALLDFFCTLFMGVPELYYMYHSHYFLGSLGCKATGVAYTLYFSGSTLLMVFSSVERYYHAMLLHRPASKWKMALLYLCLYAYLALLSYLTVTATYLTESHDMQFCSYGIYFFNISFLEKINQMTKVFHVTTGFILPGIALAVIFFKIRMFIRNDSRRYRVPLGSFRSGGGSGGGGLRRHTMTSQTGILPCRIRIFNMLALSVGCFFLCQLPYVAINTWKFVASTWQVCIYPADQPVVHIVGVMAYSLLIINCAINPNIYLVLSSKFRGELRNLLHFLTGGLFKRWTEQPVGTMHNRSSAARSFKSVSFHTAN